MKIILKILKKLFLYLFYLLILVFILIQFAGIQRMLANFVKDNVLADTQASEIEFERLKISLTGKISLYNVFIPGDNSIDLLKAGRLKVDIRVRSLLKNKLYISNVILKDIEGSMITYKDGNSNYEAFFNSFASEEEPDSKKESNLQIIVGDISLSSVKFSILDSVGQNYIDVDLGEFEADLKRSKIQELIINCSDVKLSNTYIDIGLGKDSTLVNTVESVSENSKETILPVISFNSLNLSDIIFTFRDYASNISMNAEVGKVTSKPVAVDIGKETVFAKSIRLKDVSFGLNVPDEEVSGIAEVLPGNEIKSALTFSGGWTIFADEVISKNTTCELQLSNSDTPGIFDPTSMFLKNIDFRVLNTEVANDSIKTKIQSFELEDKNNFSVENIHGSIFLTHHSVSFSDLAVSFKETNFNGSGNLEIPLNNPETFLENFRINSLNLSGNILANEAKYFIPQISRMLKGLSGKNIQFELMATETDSLIDIQQFEFRIVNELFGKLHGYLSGNKFTNAAINLNIDSIYVRPDQFLQSIDIGKISLPAYIATSGKVVGTTDSLKLFSRVYSDFGEMLFRANLLSGTDTYKAGAELEFQDFQIGKFLSDTNLNLISATGQAKIAGKGIDTISSVDLTADILSVDYSDYKFQNISFDAGKSNDSIRIHANSDNDRLDFSIILAGKQNTDYLNLAYSFECRDVSSELILTEEQEYRFQTLINGKIEYLDTSRYNFSAGLKNNVLKNNNNEYPLPDITGNYLKNGTLVNSELTASGIIFEFETSMNKVQIQDELKRSFISLFTNVPSNDVDSINILNIDFNVYDLKPYESLLSTMLFDTIELDSLHFTYISNPHAFTLAGSIPKIKHSGIGANEIRLWVDLFEDDFNSSINISNFYREELKTGKVVFESEKKQGKLDARLTLYDETKPIISIPASSEIVDSTLVFSILPDSLIIGYEEWQIPDNIHFRHTFIDNRWEFDDLEFVNGHKKFVFNSSPDNIELKIINAELGNFGRLFNYSDSAFITGGLLSGTVTADYIDNAYLLNLTGDISEIYLRGDSYGDINFSMNTLQDNEFSLNAQVINKDDFINYTGGFGELWSGGQKLDFNIRDFSAYSTLLRNDYIEIQNGGVSGNFDVDLKKKVPKFDGFLLFNQANIRIIPLGSELGLANERIDINETGIHFNKIKINDRQNNKLVVNGGILTSDYKSFKYDLNFNTDYFIVFNTEKEENETIFGKLVLSANIDLRGKGLSPQLKASSTIHNETDFTLIMPGTELAVNTGEGIVHFQSQEEIQSDSAFLANNILLLTDSVSNVLGDSKLELTLLFQEGARYTIVTNPESGDYAYFGLNGLINYSYDKAQSNSITGNIKIVDGSYTISFYDMIKKDFIIQPNSTIYFSGPLNNSTIDLTAKDIVRTNSMALMSSESPYMSNEEKALYSQRLPYEVLFKMRGFLLNPEISFGIDLAQAYKVNSPMIASKLNKLEGDDYENERNMQVFALLVTGGFFAENTGADGGSSSSNVAVAAARNSVNGILAQQLNNVTSRYIDYVDVNLGFNTYEDVTRGAGHLTTDLDVQVSKNFLDNRLKVELDSRINLDNSPSSVQKGRSAYNTDFTMLYDVTKSGNYKVKAFNMQIYDLFDGDISNAGFGMMFTKDFDSKKMKQNYVEIDTTATND